MEYIEREAAIEMLCTKITMSMCLSVSECQSREDQRTVDAALIKSIPTADVAPVRHGRWYRFTKVSFDPQSGFGFGRYMWKCDACNIGEEETKMPYCPNCGAKMEPCK